MTGREPLATTAEVAAYLKRKPRTLQLWRHDGTGPHWTRDRGRVLYRWADVDDWLKAQPSGPAVSDAA
jgi:hypothetical protein